MQQHHSLVCPFSLTLTTLLVAGCPGDDTSGDGGGSTSDTSPTSASPTTQNMTMTGETGSAEGTDSTGADETAETAETGPPTECGADPTWSAPDWEANTADALALRAQLDTLTGDATMRGIETGAVVLGDISELTAVWDGDPSLAAIANPGYVPVIEASFAEFVDLVAAGDQDLTDMMGLWDPGPDGGIWADDSRGINEGGLEVRQLVDKGGYSGGIMYAYAVSLTEGDIDAATIDAIAAAWGNNADLDAEGDLTDAAGYAYSMGFHADMAAALATAKNLVDDESCTAERDAALVEFFNFWELSMLARTVFYGNRAEGKLLAATTPTEFSSVLHDVAEGVGVAAGFYGLPDPASGPLSGGARIIDDAQVTLVMDAFGVDLNDLGASTTGLFVESLPNLEAAVEEAEGVVMDVYGVDQATISTYAMPTPG